jgi:hypothetical protein
MMTPVTQPTEHDFELLSAYLDNDLSASERAVLEARLEEETTLRVALDELRLTLRVLKAAPPLVPPRNFTLDPARYRRAAPWWTRYRMMQLVGAVGAFASILIVAIGVLSFGVVGNRAPAPSNAGIALIPTTVTTNTLNPITTVTPRMTATPLATSTLVAAESGDAASGAADKPSPVGTIPAPIPALTATQAAGQSIEQQLTATVNTSLATDPKAANPQQGQDVPETMTEAAQNTLAAPPPLQSGQQSATQVLRQATQISMQQATAPFSAPGMADFPATMTAQPNTQAAPTTRTAMPAPTSVGLLGDQAGRDNEQSPTVTPREEMLDTGEPTLAPASTAVASRGSASPSPDNVPQLLLIIGVALFLFSIMLFGIGWLRSRL